MTRTLLNIGCAVEFETPPDMLPAGSLSKITRISRTTQTLHLVTEHYNYHIQNHISLANNHSTLYDRIHKVVNHLIISKSYISEVQKRKKMLCRETKNFKMQATQIGKIILILNLNVLLKWPKILCNL